jgi:hypothetical protein
MKSIPNCNGYFVNEFGDVFSCVKRISLTGNSRGTMTIIDESNPIRLTPRTHPTNGYVYVTLGKYGQKRLHRVVAQTFISNPDNLPEVNHIDEDKTNNIVLNLEWCDRQQNAEHSLAKHYVVENVKTGEKQTVFNLSAFCREYSLSVGSLQETIHQKRRKQHKGFRLLGTSRD